MQGLRVTEIRINRLSTPAMETFACFRVVNDVLTQRELRQCLNALSCGFKGLDGFYETQFPAVEQVAELNKDAKRESHGSDHGDLPALQMSLKLKWPFCCPIETCFPMLLLLVWHDLDDGT